MKWTKFKDNIPTAHCIYVTDYVSTWTADTLFGEWKTFAEDNIAYVKK